jgi:TPR repeat protein
MPRLIDALTQAKQISSGTPLMSDAAFALLAQCVTLTANKQFADAAKTCNAATSEEPSVTFFALGNSLMYAGQYSAALEAFRAAGNADVTIPDTHNYIGTALDSTHDKAGAADEYRQAIKLDGDYSMPHCNLAGSLAENGDYTGSENELREAIRIEPYAYIPSHDLAMLYFHLNKATEAVDLLRKTVAIEPGDATRHYDFAALLESTGDHAAAVQEYQRAIQLAPGEKNYHIELFRSLAASDDVSMLQAECNAAAMDLPGNTDFRQLCGIVQKEAAAPAAMPQSANSQQAMSATSLELQSDHARGSSVALLATLKNMSASDFSATQLKATSGDAHSAALVCVAYRNGNYSTSDDTKAFPFCLKAAEQGDLAGEENTGSMYMFGRGTAENIGSAMDWFRKAAALGSDAAMSNLGSIYADGVGIPQDYIQAMNWYQKAVDHGSITAQTDIGIMYLLGQGVPKDENQGFAWIHKSSDAGYPYADFLIGLAYQQGLWGQSRNLKESVVWFQRSASHNFAKAQTELGFIYANGVGVKKDYGEAAKWYRLSAEQGDAAGAYGLGVRYMVGQGVPQNNAEAQKWFEVAAANGHGDAAYDLAILYQNRAQAHWNIADVITEAMYLKIAANQGIADGQCLLGFFYKEGSGVPLNNITAYKWMSLGIKNGSAQCEKALPLLQASMSPADIAEAKRRAAAFQPIPHPQFNY